MLAWLYFKPLMEILILLKLLEQETTRIEALATQEVRAALDATK